MPQSVAVPRASAKGGIMHAITYVTPCVFKRAEFIRGGEARAPKVQGNPKKT